MQDLEKNDHLNKCRKSISQNSRAIHDKNSQKTGRRGNLNQNKKGHIWQTHSLYETQW